MGYVILSGGENQRIVGYWLRKVVNSVINRLQFQQEKIKRNIFLIVVRFLKYQCKTTEEIKDIYFYTDDKRINRNKPGDIN